jgi:predicted metal-dependent hydrolase
MPLDWTGGALAAGLACYRNQQFFEAHEHWEEAWNRLSDPEKLFVQALIQVTVAMHHFENANRAGALSLLERAQRKLEKYPGQFGGVEVAILRDDLCAWLCALGESAPAPSDVPAIRLVDG